MDAESTARGLLESLGGADNLASLGHCATRLRITPRDWDRVDQDRIRAFDEVVAVQAVGGQLQIVLGPGRVEAVHARMAKRRTEDAATDASRRRPARAIGLLVDVFTPLLPVFVAGGLLTAIHNVLAGPGVFGEAPVVELAPWLSGFVALVGLLGSAVFTLLPVFLGFTATARFGGTPYLGAAMGAALVAAPMIAAGGALPGIHLAPSAGWVIAGIDVLAIDYRGTVLPIIAVAFVLARFERVFQRILHGSARLLLVPLATLLCSGLVAFLVLGPVLRYAGDVAAQGMEWVYAGAGVAGGAIVGLVYSPLVVTGLHQGLIAVELGLIGGGGSFIFPIAAAANVAQASACLAVWITARRGSRLRTLATSATTPAALGIAEPAMFAVTLRLRAPFVIAVAATTLAAALLAAFHVQAVTLGAAGVLGFASIAPGRVVPFMLCVAIAGAGAFAGTIVWARWRTSAGRPFDSDADGDADGGAAGAGGVAATADPAPDPDPGPRAAAAPDPAEPGGAAVRAPVAGSVVNVSSLDDPAFAGSALGPTVAIAPTGGLVVAPVTGTVAVVSPTRHAFGIVSGEGVEILVHIGIDTVRMGGAGFDALVSVGDRVAAGDPIARADIPGIVAAGHDPIVLTIVVGGDARAARTVAARTPVGRGDVVLTIVDII